MAQTVDETIKTRKEIDEAAMRRIASIRRAVLPPMSREAHMQDPVMERCSLQPVMRTELTRMF